MAGLQALTTGCDLGSMFAVPARDTLYFTPNDKFYTVNYMDSPYNLTRDLDQGQWRMLIKGEVAQRMSHYTLWTFLVAHYFNWEV